MKKIYKTHLVKRNACKEQVKLFQKLYPDGIHVCKDCLQDAQDKGLDVWWLPHLLGWGFWQRSQFYDSCTQLIHAGVGSFFRKVNKLGLATLEKALLEAPAPKKTQVDRLDY